MKLDTDRMKDVKYDEKGRIVYYKTNNTIRTNEYYDNSNTPYFSIIKEMNEKTKCENITYHLSKTNKTYITVCEDPFLDYYYVAVRYPDSSDIHYTLDRTGTKIDIIRDKETGKVIDIEINKDPDYKEIKNESEKIDIIIPILFATFFGINIGILFGLLL